MTNSYTEENKTKFTFIQEKQFTQPILFSSLINYLDYLLLTANEVARRYCFQSCLSVHSGGGRKWVPCDHYPLCHWPSHHTGTIPPDKFKLVQLGPHCTASVQHGLSASGRLVFNWNAFLLNFYCPQRKLQEGYAFTPVCQSFLCTPQADTP